MLRTSLGGRSNDRGVFMPMGYYDAPPLRLTRPSPGTFCKSYQCHSMACLDRPGLEFGDKIILPQTAFREAHRLRLKLPLLFKLVNITESTRRIMGTAGTAPYQFCGVLEFSAPDDQVFLPYWLMQNLLLSEGARVELRNLLRPPAGSFVRFKPHNDIFLDVAARQGPKVLMEEALRRYSVLCEGATILVQHEGDNFYLDVVEVRTFAPSPSTTSSDGGNDDGHKLSSDFTAYVDGVEREGDKSGHGETCDGSNQGNSNGAADDDAYSGDDEAPLRPSAGRRVRLVSLLGDLDLEVEFCTPHLGPPPSGPLSPQDDTTQPQCAPRRHLTKVIAEYEQGDGGGGHGRSSSQGNARNAAHVSSSSSPFFSVGSSCRSASSTAAFAGDVPSSESPERCNNGRGSGSSSRKLAVLLPAPARARKCYEDCLSSPLIGPRSESAASKAGIKPPAPPVWRVFSKTFRCQAFTGKGLSLLEKTAVPEPTEGDGARIGHGDSADEKIFQRQQSGSIETAATAAASTAARAAASETRTPELLATSEREIRGRPPGTESCGGKLGEGKVDETFNGGGQMSPGGISIEGVVGGRAVGGWTSGASWPATAAPTATMGTNPAATNRAVRATAPNDECRSQSSGDAAGVTVGTEITSVAVPCASCGKLVPAANHLLHDLRCCPSAAVRPRRGSATPCRPSEGAHQQQQSPPRPSRGSYSARANKHPPVARATSSVGTAGTAVAGQEGTVATLTTIATAATTSNLVLSSCAYCGLSFRTVDAAGEHEIVCAARTERCDRCCDLVSRRETESHRRPGGGCDAAIANAQAAEGKAAVAAGVGDGGRRDTKGGGLKGGRFDALLAEAVRSSKAASAVLADAREKNDARMAKVAYEGRKDPSTLSHLGKGCNDNVQKGCDSWFGGRAGKNGRRNSSENSTRGLQLPTPEGRAGGTKTHARVNRPSPANCVDEVADRNGHGTPVDASRLGNLTFEGGPLFSSRLLGQTSSCAGSTSNGHAEPWKVASASSSRAEKCESRTTELAEGGKSGSFYCRSPCRSRRDEEGEVDGAAGKTAVHMLEGGPWTCSRCTLANPRGSDVCDACGSTPKSGVTFLETNGCSAKREEDKHSDTCCLSHFEDAMPASIVRSLAERERHDVEPTVLTGARKGAESDGGGVMPAWDGTTAAARVDATSTHSLGKPSMKFIPAELKSRSAATAAPDDGSPPRSSGTLSSIAAAAVRRNMGVRAGALPALVAVAPGGSPLHSGVGQGSTGDQSTPGEGSDVGGAADDFQWVGRRELHRPSPRRWTHRSGTTSVAQRQQRWQQHTARNFVKRETNQHQRGNRPQRDVRGTSPAKKITVGSPRRLGGVHRSRRLGYPASLFLTPLDEPPSSARSASAATSTVSGSPSLSSSHMLTAATAPSREAGSGGHRPLILHQERGLRLLSSPGPSIGPSVQGGFKHCSASGGKGGLKSSEGRGSGDRGCGNGVVGGGTVQGRIPPESAPPPSPVAPVAPVAPVCDISLSILGRSQGTGGRAGRVNRRDGIGEGSSPARPRRGTKLIAPQRCKQGLGRAVGAGGGGGGGGGRGGSSRDDTRAWDGHGRADSTIGSGVGAAALRLRRRVSGKRSLEPLIAA